MEITFLGTGTSQGVPMIGCHCEICKSTNSKDKRLRSSIFIKKSGINLVIDTGPDFRTQMLREGIEHLDAVLITHSHKDHLAGLDDVRAFNYFQKSAMDIYATAATQEAIKREFYYVFAKIRYRGIPQLNLQTIGQTPFDVHGISVIPIHLKHYLMPVVGFRIGDFTYITDANYISPEEKEKLKGTKTLVLNALRKEKHLSHFTLSEAIQLSDEVGAEKTYFTHISHQMGLHDEEQKKLPEGKFFAYDGLKIISD